MAEKPTEAQWEEAIALLQDWQRMFPKPMKVYVGARDESEWLPKAEAISKRRDALLAAVKPDHVKTLDHYFMVENEAWVSSAKIAWVALRARLTAPADEQSVRKRVEGEIAQFLDEVSPSAALWRIREKIIAGDYRKDSS